MAVEQAFYTPAEVSALLRVPVGTLTKWRYERRELHTFYKFGGRVRYPIGAVRAYMTQALNN